LSAVIRVHTSHTTKHFYDSPPICSPWKLAQNFEPECNLIKFNGCLLHTDVCVCVWVGGEGAWLGWSSHKKWNSFQAGKLRAQLTHCRCGTLHEGIFPVVLVGSRSLWLLGCLRLAGQKKNGGEYLRVESGIWKYIMEVYPNCNT